MLSLSGELTIAIRNGLKRSATKLIENEEDLATPAGKALNKALDGKFKPVDIVITDHKVKLFWIKNR